jgi:hypothetical protein
MEWLVVLVDLSLEVGTRLFELRSSSVIAATATRSAVVVHHRSVVTVTSVVLDLQYIGEHPRGVARV